jgi:hypothetical protein
VTESPSFPCDQCGCDVHISVLLSAAMGAIIWVETDGDPSCFAGDRVLHQPRTSEDFADAF